MSSSRSIIAAVAVEAAAAVIVRMITRISKKIYPKAIRQKS